MTSESELVEVAMTTMSQQEEDAHQSGMYGCQEFSLLQGGQQGDMQWLQESAVAMRIYDQIHFNIFT